MTDRLASLEGSQPPSRHRSPATDNAQYHYDSLNQATDAQPAGTSHSRRRPSRSSSGTKVPQRPASPPCVDTDKDSGKRNTSLASSHAQQPLEEEDIVGFVPKLSQIQEGKASRATKSRGSSTVSPTVEPQTRRRRVRRPSEDNALSGSRVRHKHGSLRRRAESLSKLSNPSLISVLSASTQQSIASGESNSTVTQKSYDEQSFISERNSFPMKKASKATRASQASKPARMEAAQSDVFQFLNQSPTIEHFSDGDHHDMPQASTVSTSSSSSSSSDETKLEEQSSNAGEYQQGTDSSGTSPASTRTCNPNEAHHGHDYRNPKKPLYASSFVHGHADEEDEEDEDDDDGDDDEESEASSDEDHDEGTPGTADPGHAPEVALGRVPPPRAPSASSQHSDPHTRRLRQQERELANHVFQSPRPHKDIKFGKPPASTYPPMPLYSPQAYSGASPTSFHATADQTSGWPPMPPLPAPLPIGYSPQSMHLSPEAGPTLPLAVQPPIGVPESSVHHNGPPLQPYPTQPPHYQPHASGPDLSRTTVVGYELLAEKLSEPPKESKPRAGKIVPMYRKFEHLNHRVLLHLQDEVSELEEELRYLDECIAQTSPRDEAGHAYPSSRRSDARYGNELHYRRTELLGRIFQKLGQYNQALSSFNNLLKDLDPASPEATHAYRAWIEKREPIDYVETRFLERRHDLLAVSRRTSTSTARGASHHHSASVWFPLTLILPLMAFAIVPGLLGRLVVIVLIGGVELKLVTSTPELKSFMTVQEWTTAATVYFGLNVVLAALVR
ncbi:hypothetical protein BKA66DRAFT_77710 [Pyrenochaeta sp. MPI-SDFR-AT-0127]|nr:hypothetical protein BKA66DRAFT_77710 [Pyrenochaeta sp. MPI-SDFR-AT-0127]